MMVGDMVNEEQKATAYSIQSFLCNAGSLFGYHFGILLAPPRRSKGWNISTTSS